MKSLETKIQDIAKRAMARQEVQPNTHQNPDQLQFFTAELDDCRAKNDLHTMEFPFFSLSKNPDRRVVTYRNADISVTITPSVLGRATIWDKDILIWCASQIMAGLNHGEKSSPLIRTKAHKILKFCKRGTGKKAYKDLEKALERLKGTTIKTNIKTNGCTYKHGFDLVSHWEIIKRDKTDKMEYITIRLSDWFYSALLGREVLTVDNTYFELNGGLNRRLYELARKHCGRQKTWSINVDLLREKCGSQSSVHEFSRMLKQTICSQPLPGYQISQERQLIKFTRIKQKQSS